LGERVRVRGHLMTVTEREMPAALIESLTAFLKRGRFLSTQLEIGGGMIPKRKEKENKDENGI
jgi:hypothetical protein